MNDAPRDAACPVVLEFWCELQCPDCLASLEDLRALRDRYGDALEIRLRHFPLPKHAHAYTAAEAAEEAFAQGAGWPFTEAVLSRHGELAAGGRRALVRIAGESGLDAEEMDTALVDGRHMLTVDADEAEGRAIGVSGTPTYVIDGVRLDGGTDREGLRERVEEIADRLLGRA